MQTMIARLYAAQVRDKLAKFPAVAILGPRQCGKTTMAQELGGLYFDMEIQANQIRLDAEWSKVVEGKELVIIDEAQQAPAVFSRLRGAIDAQRKRNGRFLLLGSVSPELMKTVSESLAGRLGFVHMTPFILPELKPGELDDLWLRGGYPDGGILAPKMFPEWQQSYLDTLVSRDLPTWGLPAKPSLTMRLLYMLAAVQGQPLNASQIGSSLGLDHKTIVSYCDFLEGAFLLRRLQPYFANITKRIVKTPRLYWRDSGLLHACMNVTSMESLYRQPWLGSSWEGFVIEQTIATLWAHGKRAQPFFFRTSDGQELDLMLDWGVEKWAIEIKVTSDPTRDMIDRLNKAAEMVSADRRILVCRIPRKISNNTLLIANPSDWLDMLVAEAP